MHCLGKLLSDLGTMVRSPNVEDLRISRNFVNASLDEVERWVSNKIRRVPVVTSEFLLPNQYVVVSPKQLQPVGGTMIGELQVPRYA